jgi:hypothetical protein
MQGSLPTLLSLGRKEIDLWITAWRERGYPQIVYRLGDPVADLRSVPARQIT